MDVDNDFTVTGKEANGGPRGHGGPGSPDPATTEEGATGTSLAT